MPIERDTVTTAGSWFLAIITVITIILVIAYGNPITIMGVMSATSIGFVMFVIAFACIIDQTNIDIMCKVVYDALESACNRVAYICQNILYVITLVFTIVIGVIIFGTALLVEDKKPITNRLPVIVRESVVIEQYFASPVVDSVAEGTDDTEETGAYDVL